jgi:predicted HAD superfamily phosphohydrolase YqeG
MLGLLYPDLRFDSVLELDVDRLAALELDALLLDVDCTLKHYGDEGRRIRAFAEGLGLPFVATAFKPLPMKIRAAVRKMGFDPKRTAMVGDQIFADVLAGNLAGLMTILVRPMRPQDEPWFARWKRHPERLVLRRLGKKLLRQTPPLEQVPNDAPPTRSQTKPLPGEYE